jgi:ribonuclease HI
MHLWPASFGPAVLAGSEDTLFPFRGSSILRTLILCLESTLMIEVWTDGSCIRNPGPGGYAALVINGTSRTEVAGSDPDTTNNRMELTAVIRGIAAVDASRSVTVFSDSTYALLGERIARTRKPNRVNRDLWLELIAVTGKRSAPIIWTKVKGHSGIAHNEYVDRLAKEAAESVSS